ncbi:uncharacterized protein [Miscanthus floridulus]|uniref:uncharacterized protein n=1 Tax=Miscanthus floridulus TaxID=154761 RepID=UPI00345ACEF6
MVGGSGLNIMYVETLDAMGIDRSGVQPTKAPFHGVVLGKQAIPLRQIDLPVTFGDPANYRTETLTFELKMLGPHGVITIGTSFQCTYECEVKCCEHASAIIASEELTVIKEGTAEEASDSKQLTRYFEPVEGIKEVLIDPSSSEDKVFEKRRGYIPALHAQVFWGHHQANR